MHGGAGRRLQRHPGRAGRKAHSQAKQACEQGERRQQAQKRHACVIAVGGHGDAGDHVAQRHAQQQRRQERAHGEADVPGARPLRVVGAELKRDRADDQAEQHQHDGQIEARERGGVRRGERCEQRAAGGEEPHLVAVPHRADAAAHERLLAFVFRQRAVQDAHAQVEPVEHEVPGDQHEDQKEPKDCKRAHGYSPSLTASLSAALAAGAASPTGPRSMKREITRAHPMNRNTYTAANSARVSSSSGAETD